MTYRRHFPLIAVALAFAAAPAAAAPVPKALPPAAVIRIPDSVARTALVIDPNAPLARGEFASSVRIASDRAALRDQIERQRSAEAARFARGAGPGIAVRLRRSKY